MENYFKTFCRTVSRISFVFQGNKLVEPSYRLFGKGGFEQSVVNCVSNIVQAYVGKELVGMGKDALLSSKLFLILFCHE